MNRFSRKIYSLAGLLRILAREVWNALRSLLMGRRDEGRDHARFALQALHEDLAAFAGLRHSGSPLPAPQQTHRILIVKLDRIGDMVNTTPVFDIIKQRYPNATIDIVGHPAVLSLLDEDPRLSTRYAYKSPLYHDGALRLPGLEDWRIIRKLWMLRYPLIIYLRGSFPFLLLALRSRFIPCHFTEGEPVLQRYLKPLGVSFESGATTPATFLHISSASRAAFLKKYPRKQTTPLVVIHAISGAEGKQWPLDRFARVADYLSEHAHAQVLFLAAHSEEQKMSELTKLFRQSHSVETGLPLTQVIAAIAEADVFIGNDSGLAHIAAAVRTKEVVIWGAANLNMARPEARPDQCTILYHDVPCRSGCPEIRCTAQNKIECLVATNVADVVSATLRHLQLSEQA